MGFSVGSGGFSPCADVNGDGVVNLYDLVLVSRDFGKITADSGFQTIFTLIAVEGGADTTYDLSTQDSTVTVDVGPGETELTIVAADHKGGADHSDVRIYLLFPEDVAQAITAGEIKLEVASSDPSAATLSGPIAGTPEYNGEPLPSNHSAYTSYIEVTFTPAANLVQGWDLNPQNDAPYSWAQIQSEESAHPASYAEIVLTVSNSGQTPFKMHVDSAGDASRGEMDWNPFSHDGTFNDPPTFDGSVPLLPGVAMPVGVAVVAFVLARRRKGR